MTSVPLKVGRAEPGVIVCGPTPAMLKRMRSIVPLALAAVIASRSEMPSPPGVAIKLATEDVSPLIVSFVFVTMSA